MAKKILITGASGGFGKLTALSLLKSGRQVVGTMRSMSKSREVAEELASAGGDIIEMDVTDEKSVDAGVSTAIESMGGLDVVINNAGIGVSGMQEHFTAEDMQKVFDVNVFGVQRVNRASIPFMRKQQSGLIVYVSSLLGRMTLPFFGPYNASKWALEALAENYRTELSRFGIQSCIVEPGGYPTTFMENMITPSDTSRDESYGEFMQAPAAMFGGFEKALEANKEQRPEKVAEAITNLIDTHRPDRPFRTVVDAMGMGDPIKPYNDQQHQFTHGIYTNFGIEGMLNSN